LNNIPMVLAAMTYIKEKGERPAWQIFPLTPGAKVPLKGSRGFLDSSDNESVIAKWWAENQDANIGIATGERNAILVIDVDRNHKNDVDGGETLHALEKALGPLPDTPIVLTPNGGQHIYFRYPDGYDIHNGAGIADGIDIRANGGYVVAPPSTLTGIEIGYEWDAGTLPSETPLADLPHKWLDFIVKACGKKKPFVLPDSIPVGRRNETLHAYACSLLGKGVSKPVALASLARANKTNATPPLPEDELSQIFKKACKFVYGSTPEKVTFPEVTDTAAAQPAALQQPNKRRERLTLEAFETELMARAYDVRLNDITRDVEVTGTTKTGRVMSVDDLVTVMHSELSGDYTGTTPDTLGRMVSYIAKERHYNPVADYLAAATWDGEDRLPQLYDIMGIQDDELSKTLTHKWLKQGIALLLNGEAHPIGAEGVLVLNGPQGTGKTSLFRHLAIQPEWFREGCSIDDRDKDTTRRTITAWISELGELESTLKSDISKLKAFLTSEVDRYRLPYGREDIVSPRRTNLCATCNSARYLIDVTGNRRFWSVPFTKRVPRSELLALDTEQLWTQIFNEVAPMEPAERAACYRLAPDELAALEGRNDAFIKPLKGQVEVQDILDLKEERSCVSLTVSEFKQAWPSLTRYSAQQISSALAACGVELKRTKRGAVAQLPVPLEYPTREKP